MDHYTDELLIFLATIDPLGTLALFVGLTANAAEKERTQIAIRSVGFSAVILVAAILIGQLLLGSLGIRLEAFQLAGGIIFFLFGVQMVFGLGAAASNENMDESHDIAISPLAVPSIASPGSILAAVVLTDNREYSLAEQGVSCLLMLGVLGLTLVALLQANRIHRLIGTAGATLSVRVLGLILAALAVEMVLDSIAVLMRQPLVG